MFEISLYNPHITFFNACNIPGTDAILHAILKDEVQASIKDMTEPRVISMIEDIQVKLRSKKGRSEYLKFLSSNCEYLNTELKLRISLMRNICPSFRRLTFTLQTFQSAVNQIMSRLQTAANFEKAESKLPSIISLTTTPENLCRLDPAWYPWL